MCISDSHRWSPRNSEFPHNGTTSKSRTLLSLTLLCFTVYRVVRPRSPLSRRERAFPAPSRRHAPGPGENLPVIPPAGVYRAGEKRPPCDGGLPLGRNSRQTPGTSRRPPGTSAPARRASRTRSRRARSTRTPCSPSSTCRRTGAGTTCGTSCACSDTRGTSSSRGRPARTSSATTTNRIRAPSRRTRKCRTPWRRRTPR